MIMDLETSDTIVTGGQLLAGGNIAESSST